MDSQSEAICPCLKETELYKFISVIWPKTSEMNSVFFIYVAYQ